MILSLSITGIFLSVILLWFHGRSFKSTIYLGIFFLLISLYGFYKYIIFYSKSVFLLSLVYVNILFLLYLIGPVLYIYVRSILTDNSRLRRSDSWHLLPMMLFLVASLHEIFAPWSYKVNIAAHVIQDPTFLNGYKATFLSELFPVVAVYESRPVLILIYTLWSIGLFFSYLRRKPERQVFSKQLFMKKWLSFLLGLMLILTVCQILLIFKGFKFTDSSVFYTLNVFQILSAVGLTGLLISPFFFPKILYGLPQLSPPNQRIKPEVRQPDHSTENNKKYSPNFESDYLHSIGQKADKCMRQHQPYLQTDFNMAQLSVMIQVPSHHLAYFFREEKKQPFIHYRNKWRINHAKNLIKDGKAGELTLEAIGSMSGFTTRNTFFTAFKKEVGISPHAFMSQLSA